MATNELRQLATGIAGPSISPRRPPAGRHRPLVHGLLVEIVADRALAAVSGPSTQEVADTALTFIRRFA
jgi:hypothetical protein